MDSVHHKEHVEDDHKQQVSNNLHIIITLIDNEQGQEVDDTGTKTKYEHDIEKKPGNDAQQPGSPD